MPTITDVVSIDAQLLGIETTERDYGQRPVQRHDPHRPERAGRALRPKSGTWKTAVGNGGWVLAGIQQMA
jgi:hypothetical protein